MFPHRCLCTVPPLPLLRGGTVHATLQLPLPCLILLGMLSMHHQRAILKVLVNVLPQPVETSHRWRRPRLRRPVLHRCMRMRPCKLVVWMGARVCAGMLPCTLNGTGGHRPAAGFVSANRRRLRLRLDLLRTAVAQHSSIECLCICICRRRST